MRYVESTLYCNSRNEAEGVEQLYEIEGTRFINVEILSRTAKYRSRNDLIYGKSILI